MTCHLHSRTWVSSWTPKRKRRDQHLTSKRLMKMKVKRYDSAQRNLLEPVQEPVTRKSLESCHQMIVRQFKRRHHWFRKSKKWSNQHLLKRRVAVPSVVSRVGSFSEVVQRKSQQPSHSSRQSQRSKTSLMLKLHRKKIDWSSMRFKLLWHQVLRRIRTNGSTKTWWRRLRRVHDLWLHSRTHSICKHSKKWDRSHKRQCKSMEMIQCLKNFFWSSVRWWAIISPM